MANVKRPTSHRRGEETVVAVTINTSKSESDALNDDVPNAIRRRFLLMDAIAGGNSEITSQYVSCPVGRGSGRTQWMINILVAAVKEGQAKSMVIGCSKTNVRHHLLPRVAEALRRAGLEVSCPSRDTLDVDGSVIVFRSSAEMEQLTRAYALRGFGEFWDHAVFEN